MGKGKQKAQGGIVKDQPCPAMKLNRAAPNFDCKLNLGHTSAHIDSARGTAWNHPQLPYGMKYPKKVSS